MVSSPGQGEVITRLFVPVLETATNVPAGPPDVTDFHELFTAADCSVQVMPSGEVITRSLVVFLF